MSNKIWFWNLMTGTKALPGYEGLYSIDRDGNVYSHNYRRTGKTVMMKAVLDNRGYYIIELRNQKKRKMHQIHRLVASAFLEDYSEEFEVDHIDGERTNNKLSNLRMVTHQQNAFNRTKAKGYYWNSTLNKFYSTICVNGKAIFLGTFDKDEEDKAREAYELAKEKYHFIPENQLPTEA